MEIVIQEKIEVPDELVFFKDNLPETDDIPLESPWHRSAINLLIESVRWQFRGRTDYFVGGNMFIYYSSRQVKTREYRGPDFFFVEDVDGTRPRRYWVTVEEDGRYPDVIVELLSPTTAEEDRTKKKHLYERTFRTREYYCFDPQTIKLEGWRLDAGAKYQDIVPNERGWLWCDRLGLWLGTWEGAYLEERAVWLRFYDVQGQLVPVRAETAEARAEVAEERAQTAEERAQTAEERAQMAEAELARVKALLAQQGMSPPDKSGPAG